MTVKEQALQQAIEFALFHYDCYYGEGSMKLEIMSISNVQLSECRFYPSEGLDGSNLEKCTGGKCNALFRIFYKSLQNEGVKIEEVKHCENINFDVVDYKEEKFTVKITNQRLVL